mmetsp:Transcript_76305/g.205011  ORF Transcript_76305/g.205011 Transcript_76305/m.205011 type:complete len:201 (+) Transcript_76305:114-716(+)
MLGGPGGGHSLLATAHRQGVLAAGLRQVRVVQQQALDSHAHLVGDAREVVAGAYLVEVARVEDAHFIPHAKVRLGDVRVQRPQLDPVGLEQEGDVHERLPGPRHISAPDHADGDAARGGALAHDAVIVRRHLAVRRREADGVDAAAGARERDPLEAVCGPRAEQLRGAKGRAARQRRVGRDVEERDRVLPSAPPPPTPTP